MRIPNLQFHRLDRLFSRSNETNTIQMFHVISSRMEIDTIDEVDLFGEQLALCIDERDHSRLWVHLS